MTQRLILLDLPDPWFPMENLAAAFNSPAHVKIDEAFVGVVGQIGRPTDGFVVEGTPENPVPHFTIDGLFPSDTASYIGAARAGWMGFMMYVGMEGPILPLIPVSHSIDQTGALTVIPTGMADPEPPEGAFIIVIEMAGVYMIPQDPVS